jgi:flagellin-specific chaperone FliS
MKQRAYEKLVQNLEEITKLYRLLLDCVRKEKELLIQNNIEKLNENNARKEDLIIKLKGIDGSRVSYSADLAMAIGANSTEPRLLELAQRMGGAEGERLRTIHSALELLTNRLVQLNKENAVYAESALKTVNSAMQNIKDTLSGPKTYQKKGTYQQGHDKSGHLVSKEA